MLILKIPIYIGERLKYIHFFARYFKLIYGFSISQAYKQQSTPRINDM